MAQTQRISKIYEETFYLLDYFAEDDGLKLVISGSTGNVYEQFINGQFFVCNCPDYVKTCTKRGLFCKHQCFAIIKICKLLVDIGSYRNNTIPILTILRSKLIRDQVNLDTSIYNSNLANIYKNIIDGKPIDEDDVIDPFDGKGSRNIDDDCAICFDALLEGPIVKCPDCLNAVHEECVIQWIKKNRSCVHCRSEVFKNYSKHDRLKPKKKLQTKRDALASPGSYINLY